MAFPQEVRGLFNALVNSGNIAYATGLTATPASGAPGAFAKALADATATAQWWLCAFNYGNVVAGATVFDFGIGRVEDGTGTILAALRVHVEAAAAVVTGHIVLPIPVNIAAGVGAAVRQITASGKTLDCSISYILGTLGT